MQIDASSTLIGFLNLIIIVMQIHTTGKINELKVWTHENFQRKP